jgi:Na+/proline symporter
MFFLSQMSSISAMFMAGTSMFTNNIYCVVIATRKRDWLIFILRDRGIFFPVILFCVPHADHVLSVVVATRIIR